MLCVLIMILTMQKIFSEELEVIIVRKNYFNMKLSHFYNYNSKKN